MLFKILEGDSSRISTDITPFHAGWCYYTSDDGGFYIDSLEDNGTEKRTRINKTPYAKVFSTLDWNGGKISISKSEHQMELQSGVVLAKVYVLSKGEYSTQCLAAMDTVVSVSDDKSVVLSYDGPAYAGKVILIG